jgi:hypothetical protein
MSGVTLANVYDEDDLLSDLLRNFMTGLRNFLDDGGSEAAIERILSAATLGMAALLLAWPLDRRIRGLLGLALAVTKQFWDARKWLGF